MLARQSFFRTVVNEYASAGCTRPSPRYRMLRSLLANAGVVNITELPPEREIDFLKSGLDDDPAGWMDAFADALGVPVKDRMEGDEAEDLPESWNDLVATLMTLHQAGFRRMQVVMDDEVGFAVAVACE